MAFQQIPMLGLARRILRALRGPNRLGEAPALAASEAERRVLAVLDEARRSGNTFRNVPAVDGRTLRLLAEATGAQKVVEIGSSTGLSGMWLGLALMRTGGRLITFENDPGRAAVARGHFQRAGVDSLITIVEGDAHETISSLEGPIDLLFLDADKPGYADYLTRLLPLVRPGGLILAHNMNLVPAYAKAITSDPGLETVLAGHEKQLGITLKKR
jgi:predicted O-methyltransferase YrrM